MLFNSHIFIFMFLPTTFFIYFYLNHLKLIDASKSFLVFSSLFFYSWWNINYLPIILLSILFNFSIGNILSKKLVKQKSLKKRSILMFGITVNLLLLGYFKYSDFMIENMNHLFHSSLPSLELLLPLAISFFTFQQIAYLVDSYRDETKEYNFLNYTVFVTFFPQLIAGPIVHHKEMMPQFEILKNKLINYKNISMGLFIFSIGLFKKVVIADTFSVWATEGFDMAEQLNFFEAWITSLSYTFQLYFDFSGYTDMAIGIALLFNIKLPINFFSPYKARNIQEFWRRWHITLSNFLRDYIYIPLGGSKKGNLLTYNNLMLTFILGGIWHGAGWTFIFWGFLHGLALIIHRIWKSLNINIHFFLAWFITFNFINFSWVFFRAKEWDDAIKVLQGMLGFNGIVLPISLENKLSTLSNYNISFGEWLVNIGGNISTLIWIILTMSILLFTKNSIELLKEFQFNYKTLLWSGIAFIVSLLSFNKVSEFLYFNF